MASEEKKNGPGEAAAATETYHGLADELTSRVPLERARRSGNPERPPEQKVAYRRRKPRVLLWSFLIALSLVLIFAGSVIFYVWNGLRPVAVSDTPVQVTISKGMRAKKVAEMLEQNGLIRNATLFGAWLKLNDEGSRFQAGDYALTPGMANKTIVAKFNSGETIAAATIRFTIPEGYTIKQMADRIAEAAGVDKNSFLAAANDLTKLNGSIWLKDISANGNLRYPLEGYLFPDTYEMKSGSSETDILNRMLSELDRKLDQLPEDWETVLEERGLTVHQMLTIASLVEREVVIDEERPIVAGIIENRIKKKMPLQIDATVQYLLDKQKEKLLTEDLKVESPYNTYLHPGLPPGPIASPSLQSIEATLYPADNDYLYYVTKKDGTNTHLFASTYRQHQKNIQASEKNEKNAKKK
ncbi:endolytic transglycosylase MltG [Cohnella faecalis]|uniref:Endolytic murein transglycosylase n=2 Tax=Cohnella faecalis TaxID=2315694 RepID=A0A398CVI9_9BACL|nr:endolytic transglycosylase MltG [Cohnella faecalis]